MKYIIGLASITLMILLAGCGAGKQLAQQNEMASTFYQSGNYSDALSTYSKIIKVYEDNNNSIDCPVYTKAGESALKTGNTKLAIDYLKKASYSNYENGSTFIFLAQAYKQIDNLSLEMMALTDYLDKYPEGEKVVDVKTRLFYTYVESDNYDKALKLWPDVYAKNKQDIQLLEAYFTINKGLGNTDTCNNTAQELLTLDSDNIQALSWFGKQYYRKAEDRYRKEMKAYDNKKTNKQYRILLKALDVVTVDFKKSLNYFKRLYSIEPTKDNANYLSHIYGRLSDKDKEAYYKKLAK